MAVSIKDIARIAGVSHSTVSRALRGSELIPPHTRERIQRIAAEQGYSASAIARSLVTQRTNAIGIVVTSIADPFNGEVVDGLEQTANAAGYSVVLATSQADPKREISIVQTLRERRVDGIIIASSRVGALYAEDLAPLEVPIVLLNNQHAGGFGNSIGIDNVDGAEQATEYLLKLGHRKIAYIRDRSGMQSDEERCQGYQNALRRHGVRIRKQLIASGDGKPQAGRRAAAELLSRAERVTAVFSYNDMTALGVLEEASARHLRVPEDLSVCGFDDIFFARFLHPPLTTVRQPKHELGERAMKLLLEVLSGQHTNKVVKVRGELVIRQSTAPPTA
ncbi:MAG: LacI family DNA-binding transcriptional regulator [Acidobacteriaceae bacterium]|nr:LacI family DNA-binding transcriptional regulator [Acidobacteriaceae bacterium]